MKTKNKIKRVEEACRKVEVAENKKIIATIERQWIRVTPKLNIFNYWYYRYFTNEFELYLIKRMRVK